MVFRQFGRATLCGAVEFVLLTQPFENAEAWPFGWLNT